MNELPLTHKMLLKDMQGTFYKKERFDYKGRGEGC